MNSSTTVFHGDVVHNGVEIRTSAGSRTVILGAASGAGSYSGPGAVDFEGTFSPGNSPAAVNFAGNVVLGGSATTTIELGGKTAGTYDQLLIAGNFDRGGSTLNVAPYGGFVPHTGDYFANIYSAGSVSGAFGSVTGTNLGGGMLLNPITTTTSLSLLTAMPGDTDLNKLVEFEDLNNLLSSYGQSGFSGIGQWNAGDFNDDHAVTFDDLNTLLTNYGLHAPLAASVAPVPEPGGWALVAVGVLSLSTRLRRRW